MNTFHLLGHSRDYVAVIFDLVLERYGDAHFKLYPNLDQKEEIWLPQQNISHEIMPYGSIPPKESKVFFATAGPKNKASIYSSFNEMAHLNQSDYDIIIHPSSYVAASSKIHQAVLIEPSVTISSQSEIGFGCFIKRGSLIGHHNHIRAFTDINPGVTISSNVVIGEKCTIGSGTVIKDHVSIGENTIIGVGSVVTRDIPSHVIAFGNPCKVVRENDS